MTVPFDLWGQRGQPHAEIVGESHYGAAIRSLFGAGFKRAGTEISATAHLVPDRAAIGVWIDGSLVGYLPSHQVARYAVDLVALTERGWTPAVSARVWGVEWTDHDAGRVLFRGSVRLDLAEPHMLVPANLPPAGEHSVLPTGAAMPVLGADEHRESLEPYLSREGECWAHVTLHELAGQVVEVRLDGESVGRLTPRASAEVLPAIRHLADQGDTAAARAIIQNAEVIVYAARAHDLPEGWLVPGAPATERLPAPLAAIPQSVALTLARPPASPLATAFLSSQSPVAAADPSVGRSPSTTVTGAASPDSVEHMPPSSDRLPRSVPPSSSAEAALASPARAASPVAFGAAAPALFAQDHSAQDHAFDSPARTESFAGATLPATDSYRRPRRSAALGAAVSVAAAPVAAVAVAAVSVAAAPVAAAAVAAAPVVPGSPSRPGTHQPIPPPPSRVRFVVPPGWPEPPPGWVPPEGWQPDPGWPPAPDYWQWWVPVWD